MQEPNCPDSHVVKIHLCLQGVSGTMTGIPARELTAEQSEGLGDVNHTRNSTDRNGIKRNIILLTFQTIETPELRTCVCLSHQLNGFVFALILYLLYMQEETLKLVPKNKQPTDKHSKIFTLAAWSKRIAFIK